MLVLALQFSKGLATRDRKGHVGRSRPIGPAHAEGAPRSLELGRSLKTEERTK